MGPGCFAPSHPAHLACAPAIAAKVRRSGAPPHRQARRSGVARQPGALPGQEGAADFGDL